MPISEDFWTNEYFNSIRELNKQNVWLESCGQCSKLEKTNKPSYRQTTLETLGYVSNLSGPIDLTVKLSNTCTLLCATCGPVNSTVWQTHMKKYDMEIHDPSDSWYGGTVGTISDTSTHNFFDKLNLDNLQYLRFTGGETTTDKSIQFIKYISTRCDISNLVVTFQSNGTKLISDKYLKLLDTCKNVRMSISVDGVGEQFNYLRQPAIYDEVHRNIQFYNEIFKVSLEQTISIFTLLDKHKVELMAEELGIEYFEHYAFGRYSLAHLTDKYIDALDDDLIKYVPVEDRTHQKIKNTIEFLEWYDNSTGRNWKITFPEIAQFYSDYI